MLLKEREHWIAGLPTLEDANSIQVGLAEVMRLLVTTEVDHKTGALLLYLMQTASANMKRTSFEPEPTLVVIDRECVERRPLGATAWSRVEGREYDEVKTDEVEKDESKKKDGEGDAPLRRMIEGVARIQKFRRSRLAASGASRKTNPSRTEALRLRSE